ncbi:MAG: fibronectin type III domain-containing protein [Saprospiraceae bacterium]|nr:MAG: fibronectin type III domain-containing protein [Saprospiraceae bacterium]
MRILYTFVFMFMMMVGQIGAQTIIIGTGGSNTDGSGNDPIDDYFEYMRYQTVYTATELSTAGLTPYDILTGLGFSVSQSPGTLANYTIRIGHTTATNAAAHISAASTEVKSAFSYTPTVVSAGSFDMITFSTNFVWNGTDNIFIDICTGSNTFASPYGGVRVHTLTSGSRYVRSDGSSQCSNNTTTTNSNRPQIQFSYTDGTPPSCLPPSALTSSNITATTADISWTPPSPAPSNGYEYYYSTSNTPPGGSGTPTAGTSVSLSGLTSNTTYYFWVRSDCGGSGYSTWAGPASFKTACSPGSIPFTEGFESGYTDQTAVGGCWTQQSMAGAAVWTANSSLTSYNRTPRTGSFNAYLRWGNTDWLFYPLTLTGGTTYKFSVYARQDGSTSSDADITLAYGSTASDAGMTNVVVSAQGIVNGNYQEVTGNFTPASSGTYYIGIKGYINSSPFYISLDDISVIVAPTDAVDWCNLQHPPTGNITAGQNLTVYTQGYEPGVTPGTGAGSGISAWIGYSSSDTDPSGGGWTWVSATFNVEVGNNDEFKADIGSNLAPGTYYYASRWQLNGGPYKYGGYSSGGGGFWNGTTYVSGVLTVNPPPGADCSDPIIVNSYPYLASSTTCGAVDDYGTQCSGSYGGGEDLVYQLNITTTGNYQIIVEATNGGSWIGWFLKDGSNCANTSSCLTSATTSGTTASGSYNFTSAGTYYLIIDTYPSPTCSDFNITIAPPPINDDAPGAISLTVGSACGGADYSNYGATSNVLEPTGITTNTYATVWYKFTAPASGAVRVSTDYDVSGTLTDTRIALYEATDVNDYSTFTALSGDEDGGVELSGYASIAYATGLTSGATYYIQVDKYSSFTSSGTFCITVDELTSAMLATGTCADGTQSILGSNTAYVGWVNMLDIDGKLIMQVRKSTGVAPSAFNTTRVNIHSGGVRQDAAGKYYLDRNYSASTAQSGPFDIKLYFLGSERADLAVVDAAAGTLANLNVTHDPGATCNIPQGHNNALLTQTSSGSANGAEWVQVTTPSFSGFFINTGNNPLPVNLLDFTARATREGMVELNWIVAEEKGMKEYVVERSTDGRNFIAIGTVSAVQKKDYALTDNRPVSAVNYYRLKMVDRDGAFKYSEVRQVVFSNGRLLSLYPNPTSGHVYVSGLEGVKDAAYVNIYNEMGMSIYSGKIGGDQLASGGIDMSKYAPGAYMIRVISDEVNTTMRFVKE